MSGSKADDTLKGGSGDDRMFGQGGDDRLMGQNGDDTLDGGRGDDMLVGGRGADVFVFSNGFGDDRIRDFDEDQRGEMIDLSAVSAIRGFRDLERHHLEDTDRGAVIEVGSHSILIQGVDADDLRASDFVF